MTRWPKDPMTRGADDQKTWWPDDHDEYQLSRWPDDHINQMTRTQYWKDDQMVRGQDDKMTILTRWPYEEMIRFGSPPDIEFWPWYHMILTYTIILWVCDPYHVKKTLKNRVRRRVRHKGSSWRVRHNFSTTYWTWYHMISTSSILLWQCL